MVHIIRVRKVNQDIFEAIKSGKKKIETRAASARYQKIKSGDVLEFVCGRKRVIRQAGKVRRFKTISGLLRQYRPRQINPKTKTAKEVEKMYYSFPGYKDKIKKFGLVVIELE